MSLTAMRGLREYAGFQSVWTGAEFIMMKERRELITLRGGAAADGARGRVALD
jgi:hypothetical protein